MNILYINACVRDNSRTNKLAQYLLSKLNGNIQEIILNEINLSPLTNEKLKIRDDLINKKDFTNNFFNYANQFKKADIIVISAPYWDLSFPSLLKIYFENINVSGITFEYSKDGRPESLCNIKKLYYVTTSGGPIIYNDFGFGYIKALANTFYNINDIKYISAQNLDIYGSDIENILQLSKKDIDNLF